MHLSKGNCWEGERGMKEWGGVSIQPTGDQSGREFAPRHKGGISKSVREGSKRQGEGFPGNKKGMSKRGMGHAPLCKYCANKRLCLGYK
jgi:hypothetical protein